MDVERWSLRVGPLRLTNEDMRALLAREQIATMQCISDKVGRQLKHRYVEGDAA